NQYVSNDGKFIAVGKGASESAKTLGLTDVGIHESDSSYSNAIVHVQYNENNLLTAGYNENGTGFVYNPVWYTDIDDETVIASFAEEGFFKAGFWKDSLEAQGQAVVVKENEKNVLLMGLRAGFRNYPDHLYRLFSNAIYGQAAYTGEEAKDIEKLDMDFNDQGEVIGFPNIRALRQAR